MNFTDVLGTWKQIKEYIDTKISSSGADSLPVGTLLDSYNGNVFGDKYIYLNGLNILKSDSKINFGEYKSKGLSSYTATVDNSSIDFAHLIKFNNKFYSFKKNYYQLYDITDIKNPVFVKGLDSNNYIQNGWFYDKFSSHKLNYIDNTKSDITVEDYSYNIIKCVGEYFYKSNGKRTKDFVTFETVSVFNGFNTIYPVKFSDRWFCANYGSKGYLFKVNNDNSITKFELSVNIDTDQNIESGSGNIIFANFVNGTSYSTIYEFDTKLNLLLNDTSKINSTYVSRLAAYDTKLMLYMASDGTYYKSGSTSRTIVNYAEYSQPFVKDHYIYFPVSGKIYYDKYYNDWTTLPDTKHFCKIK